MTDRAGETPEEFKLVEIAGERPEPTSADYAETLRVIDAGIARLNKAVTTLAQTEDDQAELPIGGLEDDLKKLQLTEKIEEQIGELEAYYLEIQEEAREEFNMVL